MSTYEDFNTLIFEFITKLEGTIPNNTHLNLAKLYIESIIIKDVKNPTKMFIKYAESHGYEILTKNELYFKKKDNIENAENFVGFIGLEQYWESFPVDFKNNVWAYLNTFYVLSMKLENKNEELKQLLQKIMVKK